MNPQVNWAALAVVTGMGLLLHFAWAWDALSSWGVIPATTISDAVWELLRERPGVALLLGYLVCHLVRG